MAGAWLRFAGHDITRNCRTSKQTGDGPKPAPELGRRSALPLRSATNMRCIMVTWLRRPG